MIMIKTKIQYSMAFHVSLTKLTQANTQAMRAGTADVSANAHLGFYHITLECGIT